MNYQINSLVSSSESGSVHSWDSNREWFLNKEEVEIVDWINLQLQQERENTHQVNQDIFPPTHRNHPRYGERFTNFNWCTVLATEKEYPRDLMDIFVEDLYSNSQLLRLTSSKMTVKALLRMISEI